MTDHTGSTNTYYYITDHLGSVHAITDENGSIVEQYRYDAWGRVSAYDGSGTPISETQIGNRYLWQGREYSWNTGLYYFRARWYDPITGRWLSKDPIGIAGGLNQYVFCGNNPVNFRDPFGLATTGADVFINELVQTFSESTEGNKMLKKAQDTTDLGNALLRDRHQYAALSGFKSGFIAGRQNGGVSRHVRGHAGARLTGGRVIGTIGSLAFHVQNIVEPLYSSKDFVESRAERRGNKAGKEVARVMRKAIYVNAKVYRDPLARAMVLEQLRLDLEKILKCGS